MRKGLPILALAATSALVLTACGGNVGSGGESPTGASGGKADTITFGMPEPPAGYNNNTVDGNSIYNQWVGNATDSSFSYLDPEGKIHKNEAFGDYTKTSDDPLTVEYTVADKAVWSDGTPIDCQDFVLLWAAMSGKITDGVDDAGNPKNIFNSASTNGFGDMEQPQCAAGDKKFTVVFDKPYADWESLFTTQQPAHIVADQGGLASDDDGKEFIDLVTKAAGGDADAVAKLKPAADFWSNGWQYAEKATSIPDISLMPASGPYEFVSGKDGVITVKENSKWWGDKPKTPNIVFKYIDPQEMAQALQNGEIDGFQPATTTQDMVTTVKGMESQGFQAILGPAMSFTHIDLAQAPGQVFEKKEVRQAFMKCVPRQGIVDALAKPVSDDATIDELHEYQPFQSDYQSVLDGAPEASKYDTVDIAGAQALLQQAGVTTPLNVRLMRPSSDQNPVREQIVQLVKASCDQAGFNIVDDPQAEWSKKLASAGSEWDAVVFGWSGSGLVASGESIYVTGGDQNFGGYSDPTVDALWDQIVVETDADQVIDLKAQMENQLYVNPYNVVLFADTNLTAITTKLHGVQANPTQYGPTWNIYDWTKDA